MNIFYLSHDPEEAAKYHCDKHVVKMILESAQLLCTAHHELDKDVSGVFYKPTHKNHPCAVWVRESKSNYEWLYNLFCFLCKEYSFRYGKTHLCYTKLAKDLKTPPRNLKDIGFTKPPQAMPDEYKTCNSMLAYRNYYAGEKKHFAKWTNRKIPQWFVKRLSKETKAAGE